MRAAAALLSLVACSGLLAPLAPPGLGRRAAQSSDRLNQLPLLVPSRRPRPRCPNNSRCSCKADGLDLADDAHAAADEAAAARPPAAAAAAASDAVAPGVLSLFDSRSLNLLVVLGFVGFLVYNFCTIDLTVWRGWTATEIVLRLFPDNWRGYEEALSSDPVLTKTSINAGIYIVADWLSQFLNNRGGDDAADGGGGILEFDLRRVLRNGLIGACFGPVVHAYYEWSDVVLPLDGLGTTAFNRPLKILMDQTLYASVKYSMYFAAVTTMDGGSAQDALDTVKAKLWPAMRTGWKFWPAVHCLTYTVIPARHRVLWVNCADLIWVTILSLLSQEAAGAEAAAREE